MAGHLMVTQKKRLCKVVVEVFQDRALWGCRGLFNKKMVLKWQATH